MHRFSVLRSGRAIAGGMLLGATLAGTFFGWAGLAGTHEIGAALGAGLGIVAVARHAV